MKQITLNVPDDMVQAVEQDIKLMNRGKYGDQIQVDLYKRALDTSLPITERCQTFEDACLITGKEIPDCMLSFLNKHQMAYLKLCIIAEALRNGWKPIYDGSTPRYFPWFAIWTKDKIDNMSNSDKEDWRLVPLPAGVGLAYSGSNLGVSVLYSHNVVSNSHPYCGGALASEKSEIARHFGAAFLDIWVDYITGNEEMSLPYPEKKEG